VLSRQQRQLVYTLLLVFFVCLFFWSRGRPRPQSDNEFARYHQQAFTVLKVVDGDTVDLDVPDVRTGKSFTRVRLWGVDTPEVHHPTEPEMYFGREAWAFTRQCCQGQTVTVHLEPFRRPRDRYGRLLAYLYLPDGRMLNERLLEEGYAYADPRFDHVYRERFLQLEKKARRLGRGLWEHVQPHQWPRWYRRRHDRDYRVETGDSGTGSTRRTPATNSP